MNEVLNITIKEGEYWYGGFIDDTVNMPYTKDSNVSFNAIECNACNEVNPMLISSEGRYVYAEKYCVMKIEGGCLTLKSSGRMDFGEKESFRSAYEYLKDKYFPFDGRMPDDRLFTVPQYCTWMAMGEDSTQEAVIGFAKEILAAGLPAGELIIDDGWTDYQGQFEFSKDRFPDPKRMCEELKDLGFFVSLWVVPYVSADSKIFRELNRKGLLVKKGGKPFIGEWWDGFSACIDFTNPAAKEWFLGKIRSLKERYGIVGVKMDGGDARFYENGLETYAGERDSANSLAEAYGKTAAEFSVSEIRSTAKCGGLPVMQRIADRCHAWEDEKNGLDGIVKKSLVMSFTGYPYNCPDMVGGGQIVDIEQGVTEDEELNIRYMEAATFMPSLQFSKVLWKERGKIEKIVRKMIDLRKKYADYILGLVKNCAKTGEPIIRTMLYQYGILPEETRQFTVGDKILVAPVLQKGVSEKEVYLPVGKWRYEPTGEVYSGGGKVTVPAPLEVLPYFIKCPG